MPIAHFSISARRNTQAQPAGDVVKYLKREGAWREHNKDKVADRDVAYLTRKGAEVQARNDLVDGDVRNLPSWAGKKAEVFFEQAAQWERVGGRYAYVIQMSLPRSLTHEQQMALKDDFIEATMSNKPLLWVKHEPVARDGEPNPHHHIMLSARIVDGLERSPEQTFARFNREEPEKGGCEKDRFWNERASLQHLRMAFTDISNFHLERANAVERMDPRRLADQGIERRSFGKASRGKTLERDVEIEQLKASAAWEQRKVFVGMVNVHDISREAFVEQVRQRTQQYERGNALPRATPEEVAAYGQRESVRLAQEGEVLAKHTQRLEAVADEITAILKQGKGVAPSRMIHLAAQAQEEISVKGLAMKLYEKERDEGYGR